MQTVTIQFPEGEDYQEIISKISSEMMRQGIHPADAKHFREQADKAIKVEMIRVAGEWANVVE